MFSMAFLVAGSCSPPVFYVGGGRVSCTDHGEIPNWIRPPPLLSFIFIACIRHNSPRRGRMVETAAGFTASRDFHPSQVLCELPPLLAAVAGQEYHCVLTASWQNNPPQAVFRTDGPARHLILAVVDGRRRRNPKNESGCFLVYSALPQVSPSASSGVACPGFRGPSGKVFQPSDILFSSCK